MESVVHINMTQSVFRLMVMGLLQSAILTMTLNMLTEDEHIAKESLAV